MALIKCPECNKEISDKSESCIHCGYPLHQINTKQTDVDKKIEDIILIYNNFFENPDMFERSLGGIYPNIKTQVEVIKNDFGDTVDLNNKIANVIVDKTMEGSNFCSWITYKNFFGLFDFEKLPSETIKHIYNKIYNKLTDDNDILKDSNHIVFWYPIYQLLTFGTEEIKLQLKTFLDEPNAFNGKKYNDVTNMVTEHLGHSSPTTEIQYKTIQTSVKCPYCNSTNVRKISGMSKAGNVALWGIFAIGKVSKQWHCNSCKSDF